MSEKLISLGLDVGTTSTQMVLSELVIENQAGSFAVPEMEIQDRKIIYKSPVHFTPLIRGELVDGEKIREIVDREYEKAGISKQEVDTGAIIITGETSRKENARSVLDALSSYAGEFVVATAGPDLESVLAAKGAGAVEYSARTGKRVLHMDIGGGTSNLALIEDGRIVGTTCLNVGGRLIKMDGDGRLTYVSPVLEGLFHKNVGEVVHREEVLQLAEKLVQALEMAAGLREPDGTLERLETREIATPAVLRAANQDRPIASGNRSMNYCGLVRNDTEKVISFSGGVADCIESAKNWLEFGDMGPELGRAIRESRLCRGEFMLGAETIRATVIGAGCHSAQLSGSTVFYQNVSFPLKNLPVAESAEALSRLEGPGVVMVTGEAMDFAGVRDLAKKLAAEVKPPIYVAASGDMAKALGVQIALALGPGAEILCIDRVCLKDGDYLDVGTPVGPAIPVVVKTLVMGK